jgi:hypothetical protein
MYYYSCLCRWPVTFPASFATREICTYLMSECSCSVYNVLSIAPRQYCTHLSFGKIYFFFLQGGIGQRRVYNEQLLNVVGVTDDDTVASERLVVE